MADAIIDRPVTIPVFLGEKKGQLFRAFERNQGFVAEFIDTKIAEGFIRAKFHFPYYTGLTFRPQYSSMSDTLHKGVAAKCVKKICSWPLCLMQSAKDYRRRDESPIRQEFIAQKYLNAQSDRTHIELDFITLPGP